MFRFSSLSFVVACAVSIALATPQTASSSQSICDGYQWGVVVQQLTTEPMPVYNQYVDDTSCNGPAWVQSSTVPDPPASIKPWGVTYECEVPEIVYYCGETPVATCCGKLA